MFKFFTVSTGLGAGFVINKEIYHGAHGFGNEVANCVMMKDGPSHGSIIPGGIEAISSVQPLHQELLRQDLM